MTPSELTGLLAQTIPAGAPILVVGAPGIGKSQIIEQATKAAGANLIVSHPAVSDPTDAKGLPWISADQASARFLPFGDLSAAISATTRTVWFLDDLGQAPASVQASYMQLLLARRVNEHRVPECVTFIAATNRRTDRANVSGILEPVKSRFTAIVELETTLDDWCGWAMRYEIEPQIVAFLRFRPALLSAFAPTADLTNSPTPRTWAHASRLMTMGLPAPVLRHAVSGAVGEGAAAELFGFLEVYTELPDLDDIIGQPSGWGLIPKKAAALYAVVTGLAMKATATTIAPIVTYGERLAEKGHGEFAALLLRDIVRRDPAMMVTPAVMGALRGPLGALIEGHGKH